MKLGNVSQNVLRRSVLRQLRTQRDEVVTEPSAEEMCAVVEVKEGEQAVLANTTLCGNEKDLAVFAVHQVLNDLGTRGAEPVGVNLTILLPPHAYESRLKAMAEFAEDAAKSRGVQIMNAKAGVSPAVTMAVVTVVGMGTIKKGGLCQTETAKAGQEIVLTKWIGVEGMLRILREKEEELAKRFVPSFINQIKQQTVHLSAGKELRIARDCGVRAMYPVGEGGIFAALWYMAGAAGTGLEADLKKISVKQETVEVCEYFHLNPYQMTSAGCILFATDHGEELAEAFGREGIHASVIGKLTPGNDRVLLNGGERRYLDRPAQDELLKIYGTAEEGEKDA